MLRALFLLSILCGPCFAGSTFQKDVLPILQQHCQSCHRPGQIAPMPLLTYAEARPWAKAIKAQVLSRKMPPWFADPRYGRFSNDPSLTSQEIRVIADWADSGAPEGDPRDAPPPLSWPEGGWEIHPDTVVAAPEFDVPPSGILDWIYLTFPSGFTQDTWVSSIEILPSDASVVHHAALFFKPHTTASAKDPLRGAGSIEAVYVPGAPAMDFRAWGAAKLIPANSDLVLQVHCAPSGHEVAERLEVGFSLVGGKPARRFITFSPQTPSILDRKLFRIPAGAADWESPPVDGVFHVDAELAWFLPHMHLRGRDMTYWVTQPGDPAQIVLSVPNYNPNWQLAYQPAEPLPVHAGTRLNVTAHYDNSANNKFNPDWNRDVFGGTQTFEEMMAPFFGVIVDSNIDPRKVMTLPGQIGHGGG